MTALHDELIQQPQALHNLVDTYQDHTDLLDFPEAAPPFPWVLTGMGASYHVALIGALHFTSLGIQAVAIESSDLVNYAPALRQGNRVVYISQSGNSGEVLQLLEDLPAQVELVAVTNDTHSSLARRADRLLPLMAGAEALVASKTYLNSLALLWLLAQRAAGQTPGACLATLRALAERVETGLALAEENCARLLDLYQPGQPLLFTGHGPHAATARQAAMVLSEWPKVPALHSSVGAFRHGFIETICRDYHVAAFASPGKTQASTLNLALELSHYGAQVLVIENGWVRGPGGPAAQPEAFDEFLSPLLDILPIQLLADRLAVSLSSRPGFRYISKVVQQT